MPKVDSKIRALQNCKAQFLMSFFVATQGRHLCAYVSRMGMGEWTTNILPIVIALLLVFGLVWRLPKVDLGHSAKFLRRRRFNWLPMGLTYALLYMGRYNLTVSKNALGNLMTKADFGQIFFWGTLVYGVAFLLNGPLTDKFGGRKALLTAAIGSAAMNVILGFVTFAALKSALTKHYVLPLFCLVYAANMYFQSFGAVAIVKVNAAWFHVRERGIFGAIFGILISLGIYLAFDGGKAIVDHLGLRWVFWLPAILLIIFAGIDFIWVKDSPQAAGLADFDLEDAPQQETASVLQVIRQMLTHPIIMTIAFVEFCTGFLRNAIMHWYIIYAHQTGISDSFVPKHWGMLLCLAGIFGGAIAGILSDKLFQSRRGPVAVLLYGAMALGCLAMVGFLDHQALGFIVVLMSVCVIGVHGMLSGTASMDFGGRKNTGIAVGIIDGFVYLGTAAQALILGNVLPEAELTSQKAWLIWPLVMLPLAFIGFISALKLWHAKPKQQTLPSTKLAKAA